MGEETPEFHALFPQGVSYHGGGSPLPLHSFESSSNTLLQLKGDREIYSRCVTCALVSINRTDVFVLDAGNVIFQFNGSHASYKKRVRGIYLRNRVRDVDRAGRARCVVVEEGDEDEDAREFFQLLGAEIPKKLGFKDVDYPKDEKYVQEVKESTKLYRLQEVKGVVKAEKVEGKVLERAMLKTDGVYFLSAQTAYFVWIGKQTLPKYRWYAQQWARACIAEFKLEDSLPLTRECEGLESYFFKEYFSDWHTLDSRLLFPHDLTFPSRIARVEFTYNIDFDRLYPLQQLRNEV